jgi:PEP-CTERM motif
MLGAGLQNGNPGLAVGVVLNVRQWRISMRKMLLVAGTLVVVAGFAGRAKADTVTTYLGADNDVTSLSQMTNSVAAETAFAAAAPGLDLITFESAVPSGLSISGGSITNNSGCGALCGFNTTPGGQYFYLVDGGTATFTFTTPIDAFGMYITGLQTDLVPQETITFSDSSTETIDTPTATGGGGAFMGFTDIGASIVSVSYNATDDIVSLDDVQYGHVAAVSAVPEPSSLLLLGTGLLVLGTVVMRKRALRENS